MDFASFVKKLYRDDHDASQRNALQRLGRVLDRVDSVEPLLRKNDPVIEPFSSAVLARLADAHRDYVEWKNAAKSLRRLLAKNNLAVPDGSLDLVYTPHEISALERIASISPRSVHLDYDAWANAVQGHMDLWRACVELSLAHGSTVIELAEEGHPDAEEFAGHVSKRTILSEIRGYSWLSIRRGERAGILSVGLELPWNEINRQAEARLPLFGLAAEKRGIELLVQDLVSRDLELTVRHYLDSQAEQEALRSARSAYMGLLATPPLQVDKVIAAYVGKPGAPVGLAVLDKKGDVVESTEVAAGDDARTSAADMIARLEPQAVVLQASSHDAERLQKVELAFESLPTERVHDAAIGKARESLPMSPMVANAVVLGRRALKPGREWGRIDPVSLGLGEYPREIDPEKLRFILTEAKLLSSWERRQQKSPGHGKSAATLPSGKRLNPFLKTIRDLRSEMTVDGIITNITRFGAFVNIGLPTEGMIHVSQLSTKFVEDPAEVVRVGQQVKARVLEVVPEKDRIALSLKPPPERMQREPRPPSADLTDRKGKRAPPKSRADALADLNALFKK